MTSYKDFQTIQKKIFFSKSDIPLLYKRKIDDIDSEKAFECVDIISRNIFHRKPGTVEKLGQSTLHEVYKIVIESQSYIIRISKLRNFFSDFFLQQEDTIVKVLKSHAIAVPEIFFTDLSRKYIPYDYQISAYIKGNLLYSLFKKEHIRDSLFFQLGKMIAHVHTIKTENYGSFDLTFAKKNKLKGIHKKWCDFVFLNGEKHLDYCRDKAIIDQTQYSKLRTIFYKNKSQLDNISPVLLHGDIANHNVLCAGSKIVCLLDWEDSISGDQVFDIAYYGTGLYKQNEYFRNFLNGYISVSNLIPDKEFWRRYWLYFIRISIAKAVSRFILGESNKNGAPDISERITIGIKNFK